LTDVVDFSIHGVAIVYPQPPELPTTAFEMSNFLKRIGKLLPFGRNKPVGYDIEGMDVIVVWLLIGVCVFELNFDSVFKETDSLNGLILRVRRQGDICFLGCDGAPDLQRTALLSVLGGRPRRSVEYKIKRDIPDYLVQERLPGGFKDTALFSACY
jgi:hypothetical protein